MSNKRDLLTSPTGSIQVMAAENPFKNANGKEEYTIRLAFDVEKDRDFLDTISDINDAKVVTAQSYRGKSEAVKNVLAEGKALVSATTQFKPPVWDLKGKELEESPYFFADSTGEAQMIVQPYYGEKGGTINLMGIIIHNITHAETGDGTSREDQRAKLRAAVEAATK
jgi:hypothetical protein